MLRYMLDTDTCSYIMKRSNDAVLSRLRKVPVSEVCISVITKSELLFGVEVSPRRQRMKRLWTRFCGMSRFWISPIKHLRILQRFVPT